MFQAAVGVPAKEGSVRRRMLLLTVGQAAPGILLSACGVGRRRDERAPAREQPAAVDRALPEGEPGGFAAVPPGTTGGKGGATVTVSSSDEFVWLLRRPEPLIIQVSGTLTLPGRMHPVAANKTIVGIGATARLLRGGLRLSQVHNVIIRNLTFEQAVDDAITLQDGTHHIWIDHNVFVSAADGLVDITRQSSYVTVSWNIFGRNHDKASLVGNDDNYTADMGTLRVTYHYNWFQSHSRLPRVRYGQVHVFNNFYDGVRSYGIASTMSAAVVVEANYFLNTPRPMVVGYGTSSPGDLVERGNIYVNSGTPETQGEAFDPSAYYAYRLDDAADVPSIVRQGAGVGKL